MEAKHQVITLEQGRRFHALGVERECYFCYVGSSVDNLPYTVEATHIVGAVLSAFYYDTRTPAFTLSELLIMLGNRFIAMMFFKNAEEQLRLGKTPGVLMTPVSVAAFLIDAIDSEWLSVQDINACLLQHKQTVQECDATANQKNCQSPVQKNK